MSLWIVAQVGKLGNITQAIGCIDTEKGSRMRHHFHRMGDRILTPIGIFYTQSNYVRSISRIQMAWAEWCVIGCKSSVTKSPVPGTGAEIIPGKGEIVWYQSEHAILVAKSVTGIGFMITFIVSRIINKQFPTGF